MINVKNPIDLKQHIGQTIVCPEPVCVSIEMLRQFLKVSLDNQAIHDPERGEGAVVPANLLLSVIPRSLQSGIRVEEFDRCFTVSYKKVRFFEIIHPESPMTLFATITSVRRMDDSYFVETAMELQINKAGNFAVSLVQTDCYS